MPDQKVYLREANDLTVTFAMIETRTALDEIKAMTRTTPGSTPVPGPADLSIALSNGADVDPWRTRSTASSTIARGDQTPVSIMGAYCQRRAWPASSPPGVASAGRRHFLRATAPRRRSRC